MKSPGAALSPSFGIKLAAAQVLRMATKAAVPHNTFADALR